MANTIMNTFSLLAETDRKLEQIAAETFLRTKGNVIDWAVDELYKRLHPEAKSAPAVVAAGVDLAEPEPSTEIPDAESEAALLMERE